MKHRIVLIGVIIVGAALAGCIGSDGGDASGAQAGTAQAGATGAGSDDGASNVSPLSFDAPPADETFNASGTYSPAESCPAGCVSGDYEQSHDITDKIPVGLPVALNVTLTYDQDVFNYVDVDLVAEDGEVYEVRQETSFSQQTVWLEAVVARTGSGGSFETVTQAFWPDDGETTYEMTVDVRGLPDRVPAQVPVEVPVTAGMGEITVSPQGAADGFEVMVWNPDDTWHGTLEGSGPTTFHPGDAAGPGDYVFLLKDPGPGAGDAAGPGPQAVELTPRNATDGAGSLAPLALEETAGEAHPVNPGETVTWEVDAANPPVAAGVRIHSDGVVHSHGPTFLVRDNLMVGLEGPGGTLVDFSGTGCGICITGPDGVTFTLASGSGHPNLAPGTLEASVTLEDGTPIEARHVLWTYSR